MAYFSSYIIDFVSLFCPRLCQSCNKALIYQEECICSLCRYHLPKTNLHMEYDNELNKIFQGRLPIETATSLFYFQKKGKVQNLIHQFKYKGKREVGRYFGKMLGQQLKQSTFYNKLDLIIPVPLHAAKEHIRGFNQSEIIALGISDSLNKPVISNNLLRITRTDSQTRKSRFKRWQNVETVFQLKYPDSLKNSNILLVDDVITTGSTLEACGQTLMQKTVGVKLWIATLALAR